MQFCRFFLCFCPNGQFDRFGFPILRGDQESDSSFWRDPLRRSGGGFYVLLGANRTPARRAGALLLGDCCSDLAAMAIDFCLVGDFCHLPLPDLFNTRTSRSYSQPFLDRTAFAHYPILVFPDSAAQQECAPVLLLTMRRSASKAANFGVCPRGF
ncbi:hypothetical protein KCP78_15560 [Salmonella enterica subsp. enterica]|nr:hypothetical protein KCP78_15560 [Salmonella enterica subsp. enterica]